jgi:hypothetical protein
MVVGGPALYLVGESLFRLRVTGVVNARRLSVAGVLVLLAPVGAHLSALALSAIVAALLSALALSELRPVVTRLVHLHQQPEGASS